MVNKKFMSLDKIRNFKRFFIERKMSMAISLAIAGLFTSLLADKDFIMNLDESCHTLWLNGGVIIAFILSIWRKLKPLTKKMCCISFEFLARVVFVYASGSAIWFLLARFFKKLKYFQPGDLAFGAFLAVFCSYFMMSLILLYPVFKNHKATFLRWRKTTVLYSMQPKKKTSSISKSSKLMIDGNVLR